MLYLFVDKLTIMYDALDMVRCWNGAFLFCCLRCDQLLFNLYELVQLCDRKVCMCQAFIHTYHELWNKMLKQYFYLPSVQWKFLKCLTQPLNPFDFFNIVTAGLVNNLNQIRGSFIFTLYFYLQMF